MVVLLLGDEDVPEVMLSTSGNLGLNRDEAGLKVLKPVTLPGFLAIDFKRDFRALDGELERVPFPVLQKALAGGPLDPADIPFLSFEKVGLIAFWPGTFIRNRGVAEIDAAVPGVLAEGLPFVFEDKVFVFLLGLHETVAALDEDVSVLHFRLTFQDRPSVEILSVKKGNPFFVGAGDSRRENCGGKENWQSELFSHDGTIGYEGCGSI